MLKIAVTGSIGSGKTSVCNCFRDLGLKVISSDIIAREAVKQDSLAYNKIIKYFGKNVLTEEGGLKRQKLRRIIINDRIAKKALESFIHPEIIKIMDFQIAEAEDAGVSVVLVEVPLLFELGLENRFDMVITVIAGHELCVKRLIKRDNVSKKDAEAFLKHQLPDDYKANKAGFMIKNDGSLVQMKQAVECFYREQIQKYVKGSERA